MFRLNINKILDLLIEINIGLVVFFIPLYFSNLFFPTFNNFELAKSIIFRFLVLALFFLTFSSLFLKEKRLLIFSKVKGFKKNWQIPSVVFFILFSYFLSTVFSIDIYSSFWGIYSRQMGFITIIYLSCFYFLIYININSFSQIRRIFYYSAVSSFLVCLYGFLQIIGIDFVNWSESFQEYGRVTSSFGQPNFLAFYLLFQIPITFYLLYDLKKLLFRFLFLFLLSFQIFILIFTHSLSGLIGFIFGILIFSFLNLKKITKINYKIIGIVFVFLVFVFFIISGSFVYRKKISGLVNLNSGNIVTRLTYYRTAVKEAIKRPLLGYGPETQNNIFLNDYQEVWSIYNNINSWPNRAHNFFMDLFLTLGLFGILAYLFLFFVIIKTFLILIKNSKFKNISIVLFISLFSYFIALQFLFEFSVGIILFYLFLALFSVSLFLSEEKDEVFIENKKNKKIIFIGFLLIPFIIFILLFAFVREKKLLLADYYYWGIDQAYREDAYLAMFDFKDKIDNLVLPNNLYDYKFSQLIFYNQNILNNPKYKDLIRREFLEILQKNINKKSFTERLTRANALYVLSYVGDDLSLEAIKEFKSINEEIKNLPLTYFVLARAYLLDANLEEALEILKQGIEILPDLDDVRVNDQHKKLILKEYFRYYLEMGDIYMQKQKYELAEHYYRLAQENDFENYTALYKIANTYFLRKDYKTAEKKYLNGYEKNPNNYIWSYMLSRVYKENEDYFLAKKYINIAYSLSNQNAQIQNLKKEIDLLK